MGNKSTAIPIRNLRKNLCITAPDLEIVQKAVKTEEMPNEASMIYRFMRAGMKTMGYLK